MNWTKINYISDAVTVISGSASQIVVCYLGDNYTYIPWYSIAVYCLQSKYPQPYYTDHKECAGTLIGCVFTGNHFEFRIVEGYSRKVRLALGHLQGTLFVTKR